MSTLTVTYLESEEALEAALESITDVLSFTVNPIGTVGSEIIFDNGVRIVLEEAILDGQPVFDTYRIFGSDGGELLRYEGFACLFENGGFYQEIVVSYGDGDTEVFGFDFLRDVPNAPVSIGGDDAESLSVDFGDGIDTINLSGFSRADIEEVLLEDGTVRVVNGDDSFQFGGLDRVALDDGTYLYGIEGEFVEYVYGVYAASLDRTPDEAGFLFWNDVANSGEFTREEIAALFIESPEFAQLVGSELTDEVFINELYQIILDREADMDGFDFWLGVFESGQSRASMIEFFVDSVEYQETFADDVDNGIWVI